MNTIRMNMIRTNMSQATLYKRFYNRTEQEDYVEEELIFENPRVQIILIFLYSIVFLFCFFGNLTVVLVMKLHWRMRSVTKFCLGNLAIANLCVGIFCVYQNLSLFLIDSWVFGKFLCKMYHFINSLSHTASILILVVISVERYLVILHPFKCRSLLTIQRLRFIILGVWITSALICLPRLYFIITIENPIPMKDGEYEVICALGASFFFSPAADLIHFTFLFLLPLIIISILYVKVGLFLRQRDRFWCSVILNRSSSGNSECEIRVQSRNVTATPKNIILQRKAMNLSSSNNLRKQMSYIRNQAEVTTQQDNRKRKLARSRSQCVSEKKLSKNKNKNARYSIRYRTSGSCERNSRMIRPRHFPCRMDRDDDWELLPHRAFTTVGPSHRSTVRLLIAVVITFAVCNLPFHLRKLFQNYIPESALESDWTELATPLTFLLMYANCAINPILYAFMSKIFRESMFEFFRCKYHKESTVVRRR